MAENRSTESKGTAPALSELLMQTEWADEDDVAAFCYRYIYENLLDFLRANWKDESRIGVEYGTTQAEIDKKHSMVFIGNIYDSANKFGAEVREKMAEFILDHGLKEEINWPVQWIQIDTIRRSEIKNAIDQNIDDYYKDRFYIDLLNTKYPNPDRPTALEQAVAARVADRLAYAGKEASDPPRVRLDPDIPLRPEYGRGGPSPVLRDRSSGMAAGRVLQGAGADERESRCRHNRFLHREPAPFRELYSAVRPRIRRQLDHLRCHRRALPSFPSAHDRKRTETQKARGGKAGEDQEAE